MLEAVDLVFNEGYTATAGEQWARAELCQEAMRLGRMLAALEDTDWVRIASLYGDLVALTARRSSN